MPQLGDFLSRFRPAGTPGAASRAGVPADRVAELSAELEPVLGLLAATDERCTRIVEQAAQEAGRITAAAREQAKQIVADGSVRAQTARGEAAGAVLAAARAEATAIESAAAQRSRSRPGPSEEQVLALIAEAVRLIQAMPASDPGLGSDPVLGPDPGLGPDPVLGPDPGLGTDLEWEPGPESGSESDR